MAKNFVEYAKTRIGLSPRPLSLNNSEKIIDELVANRAPNRDIVVVEFGFNHGNDSRHIINILLQKLGVTGWQFWGYDHKNYFMAENIFYGFSDKDLQAISRNIKLIPCYFEDIAQDASLLPESIDYVYSNKSLSMVKPQYFFPLLEQIVSHIAPHGVMCCSLHTYSDKDPFYLPTEAYIKMLNDECGLFRDFQSIADFTKQQYFSFISTKNGKHSFSLKKGISDNDSELLYEQAFRNEKKD